MVLNENQKRYTIFIKKTPAPAFPAPTLIEPYKLSIRVDFGPVSKNTKSPSQEARPQLLANKLLEAIISSTESEAKTPTSQNIRSSTASSLISVDQDCSVLSLNFTRDSFYQSNSRKEWLEGLTGSKSVECPEPEQVEKFGWLKDFQKEAFLDSEGKGGLNGHVCVKRAIRIGHLQLVKGARACDYRIGFRHVIEVLGCRVYVVDSLEERTKLLFLDAPTEVARDFNATNMEMVGEVVSDTLLASAKACRESVVGHLRVPSVNFVFQGEKVVKIRKKGNKLSKVRMSGSLDFGVEHFERCSVVYDGGQMQSIKGRLFMGLLVFDESSKMFHLVCLVAKSDI